MYALAQHDHPDDPDALSDEGIALDIAELIEDAHKRGGGPGAFFNAEQQHALERLARWANANGYQEVTRAEHKSLELGQKPTKEGYDRRWVHAINGVLEDRESEVRISDLDDWLWERYLGPLVDEVERSAR